MSAISYRPWDIWINSSFFGDGPPIVGYFECTVLPTGMVPQTVEFLTDNFEIRNRELVQVVRAPIEIVRQIMTSEEGDLCFRLYEQLDTAADRAKLIEGIQQFVESLSLALDSALICQKIRFVSHQYGKLLTAFRRPIARGISFEVEERGIAAAKLQGDLNYYQNEVDDYIVVGSRHYLAGMQLLSLEDQIAGLIDAAFMQFYQGCEALCRHPTGELEGSKKFIASKNVADGRELQIIAHQVWRVRHKYFGHGDVRYNIRSNLSSESASAVARQVLVARYLCRRLVDLAAPSGTYLTREMHLFFGKTSGNFMGTIQELEGAFRVDFDRRDSRVYDATEVETEIYTIT